jgi:hypothetical protein
LDIERVDDGSSAFQAAELADAPAACRGPEQDAELVLTVSVSVPAGATLHAAYPPATSAMAPIAPP